MDDDESYTAWNVLQERAATDPALQRALNILANNHPGQFSLQSKFRASLALTDFLVLTGSLSRSISPEKTQRGMFYILLSLFYAVLSLFRCH